MGSSDSYQKCPFGTYCPPASAQPIFCPPGTYGSGNRDNFDVASGCLKCGRGLFSTLDAPGQCLDCTPGYVCLGQTSSKTPKNIATENGYKCPVGNYCPKGSYKPIKCPVGTYAKYEGTTSIQGCLPCKIDTYNDLLGMNGCKQCGPTSQSQGGAIICDCIGANRQFVKSTGACLCSAGYKPKNNRTDTDSIDDCELIVKSVCTVDQEVDLNGNCVDKLQSVSICQKQCNGKNVSI